MENRGGYAYGIWILLSADKHIPFQLNHKLHITLVSNISCKRNANKLFSRIQAEVEIPSSVDTNNALLEMYTGSPLCALAWTVDIPEWESIKHKLKEISEFINVKDVPDKPHISLLYSFNDSIQNPNFYQNFNFKTSLALVDMNDANPNNWKVLI